MAQRQIAIALFLAGVSFFSGCNLSGDGDSTNVRLTVASGLTVPSSDELKRKIELSLRQPSGTRVFTREGDKWVELKRAPMFTKELTAVVRSFDATERVAHVELAYPDYKMPMLQLWRYDGKTWSDSVDPGIFIK